MEWAFLFFMAIYLAYSIWANRAPEESLHTKSRLKTYGIQGPLFFLAAVLSWRAGVFDRGLVSLYYIGSGLLLGHFVFGLSLMATHRNLGDTLRVLFDYKSLWAFFVETPGLLFRFLIVSFSEEIIYRVALQNSLIRWAPQDTAVIALAIVITAVCFAVVHWHFFRNRILDSLEFLGFALLLGILYWWTGSLILVVVVHTTRNMEIVYLEYMRHVIEEGDAEAAMEAIETRYMHRGAQDA